MNLSMPSRYAEHLRVGTCSWKYDSWKGLLYDSERKYHADDYLVDYARHLTTVEVDQWFWSLFPPEPRMPDPKTVSTYAASVPHDFVFTVKAPNSITLTHYYAKQPTQYRAFANRRNEHFLDVSLVERFLEALEPLGDRLGPVMFQFEYLNARKMPSPETFFDRLDAFLAALPAGYRYAVETRNPNYIGDEFFALLRRRGAGVVLLDGYHMPPPGRVFDYYDTRTADFTVLRLPGPDRAGIERVTGKRWERVVQPQDRGLRAAVDIVRRNAADLVTTYVNVNNHYEGSAPLTIERFLGALRKEDGQC
jgi:uncharacterized protein YecE (DUF72 family)